MDRRLAAALLASLLAAPAALAGEGGEPAPPPPPAPPSAEAPKPAETDEQALERMTGEMMKRIEEIRGLRFRQDVKRVWKTRDEAKAEMLQEIEEKAKKEDLESASKGMAFFGMIKEGADLKAIFSEFISAAAGGYYLPEKKVFSLVRGFNENASRPIIFHELVHAVEDQYYDWQQRSEKYGDAEMSDHAGALHAVVEGSARRFENRFVDSEQGLRQKYMQAQMEESMKQMGAMFKAPPALVVGVGIFPYENGSQFLGKVLPEVMKGTDGRALTEVEALAAIYADPPLSSEQILHPEKYLGARDLPREVKLADGAAALGEGWKELFKDTMGEFSTGMVLNAYLHPNFLPQQVAAIMGPGGGVEFKAETSLAATGWDGDRYSLFEKDGRLVLGWVSAWDGPEDAQQFAKVYGDVLDRKYRVEVPEEGQEGKTRKVPVPSSDWKHGDWAGRRWTGTREADTAVLVRGDRVIVAERVPADLLEKLVAALAKSEVVRDPKDAVPAK